jgi:hypothetical protein
MGAGGRMPVGSVPEIPMTIGERWSGSRIDFRLNPESLV